MKLRLFNLDYPFKTSDLSPLFVCLDWKFQPFSNKIMRNKAKFQKIKNEHNQLYDKGLYE
jgi:hypothetical protein